jgi:asparagine synthase (glutamine-hydrolysing)
MCGITGWVDWCRDLRQERSVLAAMTRSLAPRGPDAEGMWISACAAFGHRRLAVIDLQGGVQPMQLGKASEPRFVLVFSGEVYNFKQLGCELMIRGHRFLTRSDTEVVLHAYQEWGQTCVDRLRGMFVFAVWDTQQHHLFLARDRLGIKPLYYHQYAHGMLFGSEPKAVLANPILQPQIDHEGIAELFVVPGAPTPGIGVFKGLAELRPGHTLAVDAHGVTHKRYWQLESHSHEDDEKATIVAVRQLLEDSVQAQLISDVPLCTLLSGGVDSSAITALAQKHYRHTRGGRIRSFSMDFHGPEEEFKPDAWRTSRDGPFAVLAADFIGSDHYTLNLTAQAVLAAGEDSLRARDLPGWGDLDASLRLLFSCVRRSSTVALSGESGDELFGGYPWYSDRRALSVPSFPWLGDSLGLSQLLRQEHAQIIRPAEYISRRYFEAIEETPKLDGESSKERRIREAFYLGLTRWLPLLLDRKDRLSMAVGLEVRVPFCDHRLVQYVWNVPWSFKHASGIEKKLLRSAVWDLIPNAVAKRRKSAPPVSHNPSYAAELRKRLLELIEDPDARLFELVDRSLLRSTLEKGGRIPAPTPGPNTSIGLAYLLDINNWLTYYDVEVS